MKQRRTLDRLAPSIQIAHARVTRLRIAAFAHGVLLFALGLHLLLREEPGWTLGAVTLVAAGVVPLLGRAAYRGNSFSAFLLLASVVVPPVVAFLTERPLAVPTVGLLLTPVYYLGLKGATGLRGRRAPRKTAGRTRG